MPSPSAVRGHGTSDAKKQWVIPNHERTVPTSTYRVQLSDRFTLDDLAAQVPYIARLGISHVYLSPIYTARPGSPHGYDIVDYGCINRELGGQPAWRRLTDILRAHHMGVVLDVVPNHMAADPERNALWRQVLRDGPSSQAARFFDIDWRPLTGLVRDSVLLPLLEEPYGQALTKGVVQLEPGANEYHIRCGSLNVPLAPSTLNALIGSQPVDATVAQINRNPHLLHQLLEQQHYRLAYWRPANDEINYRRFFGINELVAIHAEDPEVFMRSHELIRKLAAEDVVHGVRVDHVDGLLDPLGYLQQLRSALESLSSKRPWLVVEKVLDPSERLGRHWPVDGTTGYDALDALNRLFVSGRGVRILRRFFERLVDESIPFREEAHRSKRLMMRGALLSGVTILAHELKRVADASWTTRDISLNSLHEAVVEFIAAMPVYRTYLGTGQDRDAERQIIIESLDQAERRNPAMDSSAFGFLRSLLLGELVDDPALSARRALLVKRLQQYTSGVHAKGVEDTAFYRDNTLLALNEVGGNPADRSLTIREFHHFNEQRAKDWPNSMTATSTHDTKLSEDTRIRIATISVFAHEWVIAAQRWVALNTRYRQQTAGRGSCPEPRDEYRFYQTLVGMWNQDEINADGRLSQELVDRLVAFMRKSVREAQLCSSWIRPDTDYEDGLESFVRRVLLDEESSEFRQSVAAFVQLLEPVSNYHSISQLVLKCFMPGVPDFYQGCEDWRFTLTDPDNRRPVDFAGASERLTDTFQSSRGVCDLKLQMTTTLLHFRADHGRLLGDGSYRPLRVRGARAASLVAFERRRLSSRVVVVVPRLTDRSATSAVPLDATFWGDTEVRLPSSDGRWSSLLAGEELELGSGWCRVSDLMAARPWVVLYHDRLKPGRNRSL
ncbi:MAG TPA: malto-oligosyltrehalose synthase [Vicinamibacterales bacterium]|nr:malto-oligosyltrehalose synthase [Vicinamibacterales bacterium]